MHTTPRKSAINERITRIILGYFLPQRVATHISVSSLVQDSHPTTTQVHEEMHRDLTKRSELGFFEILIGSLITFIGAPHSEVEKSYKILQLTVNSSWTAHESAAVYGSVIQLFGNSPDKFSRYMNDLPEDYKVACHKYCDTIGWPTQGMDNIRVAALSLLAGTISTAALNVPILARFESYAQVSEESVTDFLRQHNPDVRQEKILMQVSDKRIVGHLLETAESLIREQIEQRSRVSAREQKSAWMEWIETARCVNEAIGNKLQVLMPQMVLWVPIEQHIKQMQMVFERWRSEWVSRGYKNAEAFEITFYEDTEDARRKNLDLFLKRAVVEIPAGTMPFYRGEFAYLPAWRLGEHVEAVRAIHADLLVSVTYRPPESLGFGTCPYQWHGIDRLHSIAEKIKSNALAGRHWFSCPIEHAQQIVNTLSSLNTVWARWFEDEEEIIESGKKLPNFPGLSFICATRCTVGKVIEICEQLAKQVCLTVFFWAAMPDRPLEAQSIFVVAVLPDKSTFYVFPVTYAMTGFIEEALKDIETIILVKEADEVPNFDILKDIGTFFFDV